MQTLLRRLRDEGGSVGVLLAMVMFVVVGMLVMTYNTAQLSKEKMRIQNAADAAALEHALWQARSMNALQNMNDEAYITCQTAQVLIGFATKMERAAKGMKGPLKILGGVFRVIALATGGMSSLMTNVVLNYTLNYFSKFYARVTVPIGYFAAQQFAADNGATPLLGLSEKGSLIGNLGIYALGLSLARPATTFVLPIRQKSMEKEPWRFKPRKEVFSSSVSAFKKLYNAFGVGNSWDYQPWVTRREGENDGESSDFAPTEDIDERQTDADDRVEERMAKLKKDISQSKKDIRENEKKYNNLTRQMQKLEDRQQKDTEEYRKLEKEANAVKVVIDKTKNALKTQYKGAVDQDGNIDDVKLREYARSTVPGAQQGKTKDATARKGEGRKGSDRDGAGKGTAKNKSKGGAKDGEKILPPPTLWIAFRGANSIETVSLDAWGKVSGLSKCPVIAVSAAQCVTGDLIPHNISRGGTKKTNRPYGFGTGATAKLVPVQEAFDEIGSVLGTVIGAVIYH